MKCGWCKRSISAGPEAQKMSVEYRQPDGTTKIFGHMMEDGPLSAATGQILRAWHSKCYHIERKRESRGDPVSGRVLSGVPTGYSIGTVVDEQGTGYLTEQLSELRAIAQQVGKAVGDPEVIEAFWAHQKGGPYQHEHHLQLSTYQLVAHLVHAHGQPASVQLGSVREHHDKLHARDALAGIVTRREHDSGVEAPSERDWREHVIADIEDIRGAV